MLATSLAALMQVKCDAQGWGSMSTTTGRAALAENFDET
jgi:hypothetical protein